VSDQERFSEYLSALRARVNERCLHEGEDPTTVAPTGFREEAFTEIVLESLEDLGQSAGHEICYFDRKLGRSIGRLNAWYYHEESGELDLFTTVFYGLAEPRSVGASELAQAVKRAVHVFMAARDGIHLEMEPASATYDFMQRVHEVWATIDRLRVVVLVDGTADRSGISPVFDWKGPDLQVDIWDLRRLYRAASSGLPYEPVEIDFVERFGEPLPCLPMPESSADYSSFLAVIPGPILYALYHEFGARLLELNVRSFLQARGKVNRGIRDTLKSEPARFLAYNNGISGTAESVQYTEQGGVRAVHKLVGLQVVNGGQTVASIHRAKQRDKVDLSEVYVQAKISIVRPEHIDTLVPLISRYANTQNRVNEADFSANHPFHTQIQRLADTIWAPGEQSRWFYERARGQYQVAKAREGDTPARLKRFESATPSHQHFDKVDLAKFLNTWDQLPHIVSRGGQKNFVHFMESVTRSRSAAEPDPEFYRKLVAKALLFKRAEKIARQHGFPAYRANAVTYTLALLAYRTAGRINLEDVWNQQHVPGVVADAIYDWMPIVHEQLVTSAASRNVTEWCKREECWHKVQMIEVELPPTLEVELALGQPLPTVGDAGGKRGVGLSAADRENIARVMQISAEEWIHICGWGARSGSLQPWQIGIATTLASYAAAGWSNVPSRKQALQAVDILRIADEGGARLLPDDD
jgi:hypothetical protein